MFFPLFTCKFPSYYAVLYGQKDFCFAHFHEKISGLCKERKTNSVTFKDSIVLLLLWSYKGVQSQILLYLM